MIGVGPGIKVQLMLNPDIGVSPLIPLQGIKVDAVNPIPKSFFIEAGTVLKYSICKNETKSVAFSCTLAAGILYGVLKVTS